MPTDAPTGIHAVIAAIGLSRDAAAGEVVRRITRLENAGELTQSARDSRAAVRHAFGLAAIAQSGEVLAALHAKVTYARSDSQSRPQLVFKDRHQASGDRVDLAMSAPILRALGLADTATPADVSGKLNKIREAQKKAGDTATEETSMMDAVRALVGLDGSASDDDVAEAVRKLLQSPAVIDAAILARKLTPSLRGWAEELAAKHGVAALRTFVATAGPYNVGSDAILADGAHEIARWSRGRIAFGEAMTQFARAHPEVMRGYLARRW